MNEIASALQDPENLWLLAMSPIVGAALALAARTWPTWRWRDGAAGAGQILAGAFVGTVIAILAIAFGDSDAPYISAVGWLLAFGAWVDLRLHLLPDLSTLGVAALGLFDAISLGWDVVLARSVGWSLGIAVLWMVARFYRARRGHDGLGMGDAKLLGAAGAVVGPLALPWIVAGAAAMTLVAHVATRRGTLGRDTPVAFGPGLAGATFVALLLS